MFAYKPEDWPDILEGRSVNPITLTLLWTTIWSFIVTSQFPPAYAAKSTITLPGLIDSTIALVISFGAGFPGINAVVITISTY